jgi:hypothetical protein
MVKHCVPLQVMGESKRRKETLGEKYGQESNVLPWVPITKTQANRFVQLSTKGAWIGIGALVFVWITIRFIGPACGWWQVD